MVTTIRPRGVCSGCGQDKSVTKKGVIHKHRVNSAVCPGSDHSPIALAER